ncbi:MAG: hypothetical protein U0136_03965 [Bdellovibrionota bacterium]
MIRSEHLRSAVIASDRFRIASAVWGACYRVARAQFVRALLRNQRRAGYELCAIFELGSRRPVQYRHGISDIDVTVVVSHVTPELLRRLWAVIFAAKRRIPVLGECEIYSADEFQEYLRFGPGTAGAMKVPQRLWSRSDFPIGDTQLAEFPCVDRFDLLRDALFRYARYYLPSYYASLKSSSSASHAVLHHLEERVLLTIDPEGRNENFRLPVSKPSASLLRVLRALDRACTRSSPDDGRDQAKASATLDELGLTRKVLRFESGLVAISAFAPREEYVVLQVVDQLDLDKEVPGRAALPAGLRRAVWPTNVPIVVTPAIWRALQHLFPFEYCLGGTATRSMTQESEAAHPTRSTFVDRIRGEYASLLSLANVWPVEPRIDPRQRYADFVWELDIYSEFLRSGHLQLLQPVKKFESAEAAYTAMKIAIGEVRALLELEPHYGRVAPQRMVKDE